MVRQESAKLSFASSNLAGTSIVNTHFRYQPQKVDYRVCIFYFTQFSYTILLREMGQNVNTNLQHSIDIKPIKTDISQEMRRFYCIWNEVDGAFFEFRVNSGKGHRFFYEVFRKLSIYYSDKPEDPGALCSQILRLFYFQKVFILRIDWSELIMWIKQQGHWVEDG